MHVKTFNNFLYCILYSICLAPDINQINCMLCRNGIHYRQVQPVYIEIDADEEASVFRRYFTPNTCKCLNTHILVKGIINL